MKKNLLLPFSVLFILFPVLFVTAVNPAGDGSKLMLKSGIISTRSDWASASAIPLSAGEVYLGRYYRILQFNAIPDDRAKKELENAGIRFLSYIPYNAYIVSIPQSFDWQGFKSVSIRTMLTFHSGFKLSRALAEKNYPSYAMKEPGQIDLMIQYFSDIPSSNAERELESAGARILGRYPERAQLHLRLELSKLTDLISRPFVKYVQAIAPPPEADDTKGRSLHRSNFINADFAAGRHYDGAGVSISLGDDGEVGPHIDFQGRLTNIINSGPGGNHGDMTSGIAVGAGNLDPTKRGMGSGAHIYIHDINAGSNGYDHIYNSPLYDSLYGAVVTSTSYSQGCNDYDLFSQTGDQIVRQHPEICMVFSAGNRAGGPDCGYGAGLPWGTITGGFKQGKNVIACANLDAYEALDNTSSQGPSADGRIKPDISSNGKDQMSTDQDNTYQVGGGTSAACPGVAGICSQLYQAYREINGGQNPESALIKASLLNSAEDIGNPGPDFTFGWGRVNALRAVKVLEDHRYVLDSVSQGGSRSFNISVPAGVRQFRAMVYWADYEGDPLTTLDLVNDLDVSVSDPSANLFGPWVLNSAPNVAAITANAVRGVDHLNNVEQVTIDNPSAGNYTVHVTGYAVPQGPQRFYIVWEFRTDELTLTYPNGGEGIVPGESEWIRWDAFGRNGTFALDYSTDNGANWSVINNSIPDSLRQYEWVVPNNVSDQLLVRVTRGGQSDISDALLAIYNTPSNISLDYVCSDTTQISWSPVNGATGYEVSMLGLMYMDSLAATANTFCKIPVQDTADTWFSVRAIGPHSGKGRRAIAVHKTAGTVNCSLATNVEVNSFLNPVAGVLYGCQNLSAVPITLHIRNDGVTDATNFTISYSVNGGPPVTENYPGLLGHGLYLDHTFATTADLSLPGTYTILATVSLSGDQDATNDTLSIRVNAAVTAACPVTEDFQAAVFPPSGWSVISSNATYLWSQKTNVIGSAGTSTSVAWFDDYSYNSPGALDYLTTMLVDLHGIPVPILTFDVAYAVFTPYNDGLRIDVSTDCGTTFVPSVYNKIGPALATVPSSNTDWAPTQGSDWRNDTLDLAPYLNQYALLRFVNINDYGNNIYVDNINIQNNPNVGISNPVLPTILTVYPNPSHGLFTYSLRNIPGLNIQLSVFDSRGEEVWNSIQNKSGDRYSGTIDLGGYSGGIYFLRVISGEKIYMVRLTVM